MSGALTGAVVALAVLALAPPGRPVVGRGPHDAMRRRPREPAYVRDDLGGRAAHGVSGGRPGGARRAWPGHAGRGAAVDLVGVLHDTAARVRSGARPAAAWSETLGRGGVGPVPTVEDLLGAHRNPGRDLVDRATAAVAAARLAEDLGMPLADVLEQVARAVAADEEHESDVAAAVAGPRSTARVLALLPGAGLVLGTLLGADPVGSVVAGGAGTVSAAAGCALLGAGWWWTRALLARTAAAGRRPT